MTIVNYVSPFQKPQRLIEIVNDDAEYIANTVFHIVYLRAKIGGADENLADHIASVAYDIAYESYLDSAICISDYTSKRSDYLMDLLIPHTSICVFIVPDKNNSFFKQLHKFFPKSSHVIDLVIRITCSTFVSITNYINNLPIQKI